MKLHCTTGILTPAVALILCLAAPAMKAQENPQQLVKQMVYNELHAEKHQNYWMYRDLNKQGGTTKVSRVVETKECWFRWVLSVNGKPLSEAQQQQQEETIRKLVTDEAARKKNRAQLDDDAKQAEGLMKILPTAFLYTRDGEEDGNIRLKFRPNPQFDPPTKAAKVFHNMEGMLLINKKETRLGGISGTLMNDVTFGWGIFGRLYKGGTFKVRQAALAPTDWEVTLLDVHIRGRALFFHTISEQQHEEKAEFQPVPDNISLARAASLVQHGDLNASADAK